MKDQQKDPEIIPLYFLIERKRDKNESGQYYIKAGILMRKWRPQTQSELDECELYEQIVVPKKYRDEILSVAHENPLAGHLGVTKTHDKITRYFNWSGIRGDIRKFFQTCNICQVAGKPNQQIPKAPLRPITATEEPFSRIFVN